MTPNYRQQVWDHHQSWGGASFMDVDDWPAGSVSRRLCRCPCLPSAPATCCAMPGSLQLSSPGDPSVVRQSALFLPSPVRPTKQPHCEVTYLGFFPSFTGRAKDAKEDTLLNAAECSRSLKAINFHIQCIPELQPGERCHYFSYHTKTSTSTTFNL